MTSLPGDRLLASVIIPTKDRPELLLRCVEAVLAQEVEVDFEVLVVNDAGCPVSTFIRSQLRVIVIEGPGRGPAAARNAGLAEASGDIVLFTDDDAVPQEGWIRAALSALADAPEAVGVAGRVESPSFDPLYEHSVRSDGAVGNYITCNIAYRRAALVQVGGFDEGFPYPAAEDRDLGYRMETVGPVLFSSEMQVVHGPRPVKVKDFLGWARHIESEWLLHRKHPQTRPPRWSIRWGPLIRIVRTWQRLLTHERVIGGSPRRAARFAVLATVQTIMAFYLTVRRWPGVAKAPPALTAPGERRAMRIAWIGPTPSSGGGVAGCAWLLVTGLASRGCEVDCYLSAAQEDLPAALFGVRNVRIVNLDTGWRFNKWYSSHPVTKVLTGQAVLALGRRRIGGLVAEQHRQHPYDVVYQFSTIELFGIRRHASGLPPIVLHPETHMAGEGRWARRERSLALQCQPRWRVLTAEALLSVRESRQRRDIQLAARIVTISRRFGDHLVADYGVDPRRLSLVPNPVDIAELTPGLGSPVGSPQRIAFVSRMSARKGLELLIDLSHRLADLEGSIIIELVGGETLWSDYRPLLAGLNSGVAQYRGPMGRAEVVELLRSTDLLIQPARYEPFGLTVAEALACGACVVATSEVGATENVNADCCTVVPDGDLDALEEAVRSMLRRLAGDDRTHMRRTARAEAGRLFGPDHVGDLLLAALMSVPRARYGQVSDPSS